MSRPVLVLGAGGLVGSALARAGGVTPLPRSALDITDADALARALDDIQPESVINAAAAARVDEAERDPERAWAVNALAPARLAALCARREIRLLHLSTDYVLDEEGPGRAGEDCPPRPRSQYARSKLAGEVAALEAGALVVRVQWVYDPIHSGFFSRTLRALAEGTPVRLVTDQVGSPTPAELLAEALLVAARPGPVGLYHLACTGEATPMSWIGTAATLLGLPLRAEPTTRAALGGAWRPARSLLDSARFSQDFGLTLPPWELALGQVLNRRPPFRPGQPISFSVAMMSASEA